MWAIIDDNGTIHSGTEEEMREAWEAMNRDIYSVSEDIPIILLLGAIPCALIVSA